MKSELSKLLNVKVAGNGIVVASVQTMNRVDNLCHKCHDVRICSLSTSIINNFSL